MSLASPGGTTIDFVDLAVQPDGRVVVAGTNAAGPFLIRYRADGTVDPSFASTATATAAASTTAAGDTSAAPTRVASALALEPDGSILLLDQGGVSRYLADGRLDPGFGVAGRISFRAVPTPSPIVAMDPRFLQQATAGLAVTPSGAVIVAGGARPFTPQVNDPGSLLTQAFLARLIPAPLAPATPGDYDGDGRADLAAELATFALFAIRHSAGAGDTLQPFGVAGVDQVLPAPGDYDGDGITDVAGYLPADGVLVYRPSSGGPDVVVPFGIPGAGQTLPAPGDYDGDGRTDVAAYLPSLGAFAYRPSGGGPDVVTYFGLPGAGASIPAPGDYDGDGITDLAVYLPSLGVLAYRPSSAQLGYLTVAPSQDVVIPFGIPGAGQTIPAPGDYDGDGRADIAAYLPNLGLFAYRPSSGGLDVVEPFGLPGSSGSIAAPGDYDGDGRTDVAVYIPRLALFAYRPSSGGADVVEPFGVPSTGQTVPASANAAAFGTTTPVDAGDLLISAGDESIPDRASTAGTVLRPRRKRHA